MRPSFLSGLGGARVVLVLSQRATRAHLPTLFDGPLPLGHVLSKALERRLHGGYAISSALLKRADVPDAKRLADDAGNARSAETSPGGSD